MYSLVKMGRRRAWLFWRGDEVRKAERKASNRKVDRCVWEGKKGDMRWGAYSDAGNTPSLKRSRSVDPCKRGMFVSEVSCRYAGLRKCACQKTLHTLMTFIQSHRNGRFLTIAL